jgi:hypothetical protein
MITPTITNPPAINPTTIPTFNPVFESPPDSLVISDDRKAPEPRKGPEMKKQSLGSGTRDRV